MDNATMVKLIFRELILRSGVEWQVVKAPESERDQQYFRLKDTEGHGICLHFGGYGNENRVSISGDWPSYKANDGSYQVVYPRDALRNDCNVCKDITVSNTKSPEQIARDIRNRFWAGYIEVWDKCREIAKQRCAAGIASHNAAATLSQEFADGKVKGLGTHASLYVNIIGNITVWAGDSGVSVSFERPNSMSLAKARRVLAVLTEAD
jgi:hypothetical protein